MLRIRSKKDQFRRCGVAHSSEWTEYPDGRFTAEEVETLRAEPMLQVELGDAETFAAAVGKSAVRLLSVLGGKTAASEAPASDTQAPATEASAATETEGGATEQAEAAGPAADTKGKGK